MRNLVLIGMPGAGKSTVGVVLAKQQGLTFVDSDLVIQEQTGLLLHEIIEREGDDGFRQVENRINAGLSAKRAVIATGGSVIYGREAMQHLKKIGTVIYLQLSCASIAERLGDLKERGVTLREGQTLQQLYDERVPLYERYADLTVNCEGKSIREVVAEISARLPK
ncbi:MAG: shikimate kinase [Eubacteriales bacterium]|nr:shikimate kinase [Eubacteriales bacterium]